MCGKRSFKNIKRQVYSEAEQLAILKIWQLPDGSVADSAIKHFEVDHGIRFPRKTELKLVYDLSKSFFTDKPSSDAKLSL
ncbi:MAG: hypothetical protein WCG01_00005 [bacterium]